MLDTLKVLVHMCYFDEPLVAGRLLGKMNEGLSSSVFITVRL